MTLLIILGVLVLIALFVMSSYNGLITLRNRVKNAYAQMDVQMKNRGDLIPGLIETVKGSAGHERGTLEAVIKARQGVASASTPEESMKANGELSNALNKLMVVVEQYPDLKANANFQKLMEELKDAEEKIRYSRQFYNDTVQNYNTKLQVFPTNIIANFFGFASEKFFEITESERQTPKVDFSGMYGTQYADKMPTSVMDVNNNMGNVNLHNNPQTPPAENLLNAQPIDQESAPNPENVTVKGLGNDPQA